jgi:hypothetical protein
MTGKGEPATADHRWYARPVFFVTDLNRAMRFYIDQPDGNELFLPVPE